MDRAKQNIKNHFAFVGILEELDTSLHVMEILLPRYYKNARKIFNNPVRNPLSKTMDVVTLNLNNSDVA